MCAIRAAFRSPVLVQEGRWESTPRGSAVLCPQHGSRRSDRWFPGSARFGSRSFSGGMALRALALLLMFAVLQPAWGAVAGLFHLCNGQAQLELTCCCTHEESTPGIRAPHGSCCQTLKAAEAAEPWTRPEVLKQGEVSTAPEAVVVAAPAPPSAAPVQCDRAGAHPWTDRALTRATAPPLFLQHCSFLI